MTIDVTRFGRAPRAVQHELLREIRLRRLALVEHRNL
jgi:hypothetical protein